MGDRAVLLAQGVCSSCVQGGEAPGQLQPHCPQPPLTQHPSSNVTKETEKPGGTTETGSWKAPVEMPHSWIFLSGFLDTGACFCAATACPHPSEHHPKPAALRRVGPAALLQAQRCKTDEMLIVPCPELSAILYTQLSMNKNLWSWQCFTHKSRAV